MKGRERRNGGAGVWGDTEGESYNDTREKRKIEGPNNLFEGAMA